MPGLGTALAVVKTATTVLTIVDRGSGSFDLVLAAHNPSIFGATLDPADFDLSLNGVGLTKFSVKEQHNIASGQTASIHQWDSTRVQGFGFQVLDEGDHPDQSWRDDLKKVLEDL